MRSTVGIDNPIVCANINKIGFRMCGGIALYERGHRDPPLPAGGDVGASPRARSRRARRSNTCARAAAHRVDRLRRVEPGNIRQTHALIREQRRPHVRCVGAEWLTRRAVGSHHHWECRDRGSGRHVVEHHCIGTDRRVRPRRRCRREAWRRHRCRRDRRGAARSGPTEGRLLEGVEAVRADLDIVVNDDARMRQQQAAADGGRGDVGAGDDAPEAIYRTSQRRRNAVQGRRESAMR